ncbi:unnamed protein product [Dibothriocephalus latus]|uniref:BRCT domain-containing protein n=1 Tax=Dibothriocephalus latus TaxID=60516 RepID=A0A3P7M9C7_DIBLA|nr:unnamed protein product [Dibothriocephalus latus]
MLSSDFDDTQGASHTKADLERGVLKASGRLVQNPGAKTTYVIANRLTAKVANLVQSTLSRTAKGSEGGYDILTADWLTSSIQEGRPLPLRREHVWAVRPSTKALLDRNYDVFGDSFTEPFSVEGLRSFVSGLQPHARASPNSPSQVAPVPLLPRPDLLKLLDSTNLSHDPLIAPPLLTCTIILIAGQFPSKKQVIGSAFPSGPASPKKPIEGMTRVVWLDVQATTGAVEKFRKDQVSTAVAKAMEQTTQTLVHVSGEWARECVRERTWRLENAYLV